MGQHLDKKPLIEAIVELRWRAEDAESQALVDPDYPLLVGRLHDRLRKDYPEYEKLDAARVPDELAAHLVQHRFRTNRDAWPLVQIGPGVLTLNETDGYSWESFHPQAVAVVKALFDSHPQPSRVVPDRIMLRYMNQVRVPDPRQGFHAFLAENLKVRVSLDESFFSGADVDASPLEVQLVESFRSKRPLGNIQLRLATRIDDGVRRVIWEILVQAAGDDLVRLPDSFSGWLDEAHGLAERWFFTMIEGKLLKEFSDDVATSE